MSIELKDLGLPSQVQSMIKEILHVLETAKEAGYSAVTTTFIVEHLGLHKNAGTFYGILWMMYDCGYIFGWSVKLDGVRKHVWSIVDIQPESAIQIL